MTSRYVTAARLRELQARLLPRDLVVLRFVSDLRFASGDQLRRLAFADDDRAASARAARRALLRLTRLGVLDRLPRRVGGVRAGSAGFVYRLAPGGQAVAAAQGWQPERRRRRSLTPGTLFLAHTLQVAELHVLLTEGDRSRCFELLELAAEPSCWRAYDGVGGQRVVLKPDSYVRLGVGQWEYSVFAEVDRGTEGSRALERQMRLYADYYRSGHERDVFPRVLWLTTTEERAAVISAAARQVSHEARELFAVELFENAVQAMARPNDTATHL